MRAEDCLVYSDGARENYGTATSLIVTKDLFLAHDQ